MFIEVIIMIIACLKRNNRSQIILAQFGSPGPFAVIMNDSFSYL